MASESEDKWLDHAPLVDDDFAVPAGLVAERFVLEPLEVRHNAGDLAAWSSSIEHIQSTPGYVGYGWPTRVYAPEENERDLAGHVEHFARRVGFTYTVLDPDTREVIGCVYVYPTESVDHDVDVRSWVRADHADLDGPLYGAVSRWLREEWPFSEPNYAPR